MANASTEHRMRAVRLSRVLEIDAMNPLTLGCVVSGTLLLLWLAWEASFGHLGYLAEHPLLGPEAVGPRLALTVIALTGFMVGSHVYGRQHMVRDVAELRPLLRVTEPEYEALLEEVRSADRRAHSWLACLVAIPIGLLVVTGRSPGIPYLLSDEPWNHDLVWALFCNVLLFVILGGIAVQTVWTNRFFARIEARLGPVDLLRPLALAPLTRRGLRGAFLWIGGSSIASVIFVNQRFSWLTGSVLIVTLALGSFAFLQPVRGLHRRLSAAKEDELERVRAAIERGRDRLLRDGADADAVARMPALLAYEHRIASVSEWPLDAPQIARFGLVVAIGLSSWVGGAVVGHLVDLFWR